MLKKIELLEQFKKNAIKTFEKLKNDKEYPLPINCPVSLFGTIENGGKETAYTRALAYLFDCHETHNFGKDIFVAFCEKIDFSAKSANYDVNAELWNEDKNNRYDIRIRGKRTRGTAKPDFLIAIEAKINAQFGKDQLKRYDKDLKNKSDNLMKICLTKENIEDDLPEGWKSLTWKDIASLLWKAIKGKKEKTGYEYVRYYISSIYQDIYGNNINYSDIYDFADDENYDEDLIEKVQEYEIDLETLIKYPNTCTELYYQTEEDSLFAKSYLTGCKKLVCIEKELFEEFCDKEPLFKSSPLNLWRNHRNKGDNFEMAVWFHGKMDEKYNEHLFLSLAVFTSKSRFHALKNIFKDLPPNKSWWDQALLLFEEPVETEKYFSKEKRIELKTEMQNFYKKIKSVKDFK